jgi:hypothetical protein
MRTVIKQILVILFSLALGPVLGCLLGGLWYSGANTFWEQIDYFPYPVKTIIATRHHAREIWVETINRDIYQIAYPCLENQTCWIKQDNIPTDLSEGPHIIYNLSNNKCENNNFVYPLFNKIESCITLIEHAADATWTTSLVLSENNKLWIWDSSYESPYTVLTNIVVLVIVGAVIGLFTTILWIIRSR